MAWPQSQDYNEAIQNPSTCFKDPDLKGGQPTLNALGVPLPCSGNFADVYQVTSASGVRWAVKCFTRGEPASLRRRYAEIDAHLQKAKLPFAVGFQFLDQGIRVRGEWHPVLKMEWVEGLTLNQFVRERLDKPHVLDALLQIWTRMGRRLREAGMAHADLQHGNVLLVPGATVNALGVKLIDYDGMWVPALAGLQSGEVGHPAYQHPRRLQDGTYSREVDRFPLLVVAAALRCLRLGGKGLWERYDTGDNLLFREQDLREPGRSPLFDELRQLQDTQARLLVTKLEEACGRPLEQAPHLDELLPERAAPITARKPAATAHPAAADPFADLGEPGPASGRTPRRAREQQSEGRRNWVPWAVGGGCVAAALVVGLVFALIGGRKDPTDRPRDDAAHLAGNNPKKDQANEEVRRPPERRLSLAPLADLTLASGEREIVLLQIEGTGPSDAPRTELLNLPPGVRIESDSRDGRARHAYVLVAARDAPAGAAEVRAVVTDGGLRAEQRFRLTVKPTVVSRPPVEPPPPGEGPIRYVEQSLQHPDLLTSCFSRNSRRVVGCGKTILAIWDPTTTGEAETAVRRRQGFQPGAPMSDGRSVICEINKTAVAIYDPRTKQTTKLGVHPAPVVAVGVAGNANRVVSVSGKRVEENGKPRRDDHGRWIAEGCLLKVWDAEVAKELRQLPLPAMPGEQLAVSGDGRRALVSCHDGQKTFVVLYDLEAGRELSRPMRERLPGACSAFGISRDGRTAVLAASTGETVVWDLEADREHLRLDAVPESIRSVAFTPDGRRFVTGGGAPRAGAAGPDRHFGMRVWETATGRPQLRFHGCPSPIIHIAVSPDSRWLATVAEDHSSALWKLGLGGDPAPPVNPPALADRRKAPPDPDQQQAALKRVKEQFQAEYAKTRAVDRIALADALLARARETRNPVERYVLLKESAEAAALATSPAQALTALDLQAEEFAVDGLALKLAALNQVGSKLAPASTAEQKALAEASLSVLDEAVAAQNVEAAVKLAALAETTARNARDTSLSTAVTTRASEVRALAADAEKAKAAAEKLKQSPEDAEACRVRGSYLCFRLGDWKAGLPLLARGEDAQLKDLAAADLRNPEDLVAQANVANGWLELSNKRPELGRTEIRRRALYWYRQAFEVAPPGLNKERLERQIQQIEQRLPPARAVQAGGELRKFEGHTGTVHGVVFMSNGTRLYSGGEDRTGRFWEVSIGKEVDASRVRMGEPVGGVSVSADGSRVAMTAGQGVLLLDAEGKPQGGCSGIVGRPVAFVGKGARVAVGTAGEKIWTVATAEATDALAAEGLGTLRTLAGSVQPRMVCAGGESGLVLVYALDGGQKPVRLGSHTGAVVSVALSPDGRRAVSAGSDRMIKLWDVSGLRELGRFSGHSGAATCVAFSADGSKVVTGGEDGTVRVWDARTRAELRRFTGHKGKVTGVVFAPDGRRVASCGEDATVRLWGL